LREDSGMEPDVIEWPGSRHAGSPHGPATRTTGTTTAAVSASEALAGLYSQHYVALVRLAVVLLWDKPAAEKVVQDAFVAMHRRRLRDPDKALAHLRRAVMNGCWSVWRHRAVEGRNAPRAAGDMPSAEHRAMLHPELSTVAAALGTLPRRQREAVILRYYADLSEAETAAAMGISQGAVKTHTFRGLTALRGKLEWQGWGAGPPETRHGVTTE
jgi:RNA polymerase sigma-70 factor (sigma-E family)